MKGPLLVIPSRKAAVPNLTPSQARDLLLPEERIISISVFDASEYVAPCKESSMSFASFCGLSDFRVVLTNRSSFLGLHPSAPSTDAGIAGVHEKGRIQVTVKRLKEVVTAIRPQVVLGISESFPINDSHSRKIKTALTRTEKWTDQINSLGVSDDCLIIKPFTVEGESGYIDAIPRNENTREFSWNLQQAITNPASCSFVCCNSMPSVIAAILANVRYVESSLPWALAEKGIAMSVSVNASPLGGDPELDLNDSCFQLDISPLTPGCDCYTCKRHNRAYIHHLLSVQEMNSTILLAIHNLAQLVSIFRRCRQLSSAQRDEFLKAVLDRY